MKVTKAQLRRIIREAVKRRIELLSEAEVEHDKGADNDLDITDVADFISESFSRLLEDPETFDVLTGNAWEMMMGTLGEDQVPAPTRMEDVEHWSERIATRCLADASVKDVFQKVAHNMLQNLMKPQGTPRRR